MRRREEARRRVQRQRRMAAGLALLFGLVLVTLVGSTVFGGPDSGGGVKAAANKAPPPPPELPRGGRSIFPQNRVVAFYGAPQDPELGELGVGTPAHVARKLEKQGRRYRRGRLPILPAFELISTV